MKLAKKSLLSLAALLTASLAIAHEAQSNDAYALATPPAQNGGFADGTWTQDLDKTGRMIVHLRDYSGAEQQLMLADLMPDLSGPESATQSRGTLRGNLYDPSQPDPWKQESNLYVYGSWKRSFDTGSFDAVILERNVVTDHIAMVGRIQGNFGTDYQIQITQGSGSGIVAGKQDPTDDTKQDPSDDTKQDPTDDTTAPSAPASTLFVTNILARWIFY